MRDARTVSWVIWAASVSVLLLVVLQTVPGSRAGTSGAATAPNFTLTDIHGQPVSLASYEPNSVVVLEFTALSCSACQIVEKSLYTLYSSYNHSQPGSVRIVSIYIEPSFGDTIPALKAYQVKNNITWTMAQDTSSNTVKTEYGVVDIPVVVVVDKQDHVVFDQSGIPSDSQLQASVASALAGTAKPIALVSVSVFALAAVAGVTTFFSPCAFPMFPGYMSLFLGLNTNRSETPAGPDGALRGAARRAIVAGSVTALGMVLVFLVIGIALVFAASLVGGYIPYFLLIVGAILIGLGALLLTNLQYWRIVTPFQNLWRRLRGVDTADPSAASVTPLAGDRLYLKLFSYGMGYAAAAAGCVAPVIFSAIVAGLALGLVGGIVNIVIYSLTGAALMIGVTLLLALAGQKYVNKLKAFTPVIKKISAGVLVVVGIYLIYFYYTAWGFSAWGV